MAHSLGRRPANASATQSQYPVNNDQLDFAFVADLPKLEAMPPKRAARARAATPAAVPVQAPLQPSQELPAVQLDDTERMACALEAHPDYRVMRRLVPRLQWAPVQAQRVCTVVILDTETTGLDAAKEKIIELALLKVQVDLDTGLPVGDVMVYDELEDPGIPIPKEVEKITGINSAMVSGKRLDEGRIATLMEGVDLVIAHNAGFDRPFVEARLPHFSQLAWACSFADISWKDQGRSSAKLESLAQALGYFYDAHRAEMDCHALLAVLAAALPVTPAPISADLVTPSSTGLAWLIGKSQHPTYRLQATNAPFDAKDKLKARGYRWNADQKVWHTRLDSPHALQEECAWLKENAYHQRSAVVQVEKLEAQVRYSNRPGETLYQQL
jgi:DNA polymerase-3 subunit epsilon